MCDYKLLKSMRDLQVKPRELKCTASSTCWCFGVSHKIQHDSDTCMSPSEMLKFHGKDMCTSDIRYLKKLTSYDFNPESP